MSGLSSRSPCSLLGPLTIARCGIAEGDASAHRDELVGEEQPVLEHLLEDQDRPVRLGREGEGDRRQVGREGRPGPVVDLRDRVAHVVADRELLIRGDQEVAALDQALQAEPLELPPDHQQVAGLDVADPQLPPGRGRQRHEAPDLDVVRADHVLGAAEPIAAVHGHHVRADAVDLRAHLGEQPGEVLDVRLAGGVGDHGVARRQGRGEQGVLSAHHRWLVHEDGAGLHPGRGPELDHPVAGDAGAEVAEGVEVGVEAAPADRVPTRRRHRHLAEAGQQRSGEQEGGPDPRGEALVDDRRFDVLGA